MVNIFTDKHSKLQFCIFDDEMKENIDDYPLIDWCKQFLNKDDNFIDIGGYIGNYSFILSASCNHVHVFETSPQYLKSLTQGCTLNDIKNISIHPIALSNVVDDLTERLDDYDITHVCFLRIKDNVLKILEGAINTLKNNSYPPFIFNHKNQDIINFINLLGYKIHDIRGVENMYLASDHVVYNQYKNKNNSNAYQTILNDLVNKNLTTVKYIELLHIITQEAIHYNDYHNGLVSCEKLILSNHCDQRIKNETLINMYLYLNQLPYIKKIMLNCPMSPYRVPNNPSIIQLDNGDFLCNIRCSNYVYEPHFQFLEGNIHLSDHVLVTLSPTFMIKKTIQLIDKTKNHYYDSFVKGIDDLRLIDTKRFICSHGNFNPNRVIQQCLGTFNEEGHVIKLIPLKGPHQYRHEKNWLPLVQNNELYVVYTIHPFTLYKVNEETGNLTLIKSVRLVDENFDVKGSAPFIPYKNGLLATVHQTTTDLSYMHRFIWMNLELTELKYSKPFYFVSKGTEFSLGMCHSPDGLILSNSIRDNYSNLIVVKYEDVDSYLNF